MVSWRYLPDTHSDLQLYYLLLYVFKLSDDEDDDPMIMVDPDPLVLPEDPSEVKEQKNQLGALLQALLYHYLALPFIRVRWFIIGV